VQNPDKWMQTSTTIMGCGVVVFSLWFDAFTLCEIKHADALNDAVDYF